jgi:hypothetical protein
MITEPGGKMDLFSSKYFNVLSKYDGSCSRAEPPDFTIREKFAAISFLLASNKAATRSSFLDSSYELRHFLFPASEKYLYKGSVAKNLF